MQCIQGLPEGALRRIILTASGGAFRCDMNFVLLWDYSSKHDFFMTDFAVWFPTSLFICIFNITALRFHWKWKETKKSKGITAYYNGIALFVYIQLKVLSYDDHVIFIRDWPVEKLKDVKVADALKHPNWSMGKKITVDSATLFNKVFTIFLCIHIKFILCLVDGWKKNLILQGLEVIEAHYLFGADSDNIEIVIHPQCIIHSMIETQICQNKTVLTLFSNTWS